MMEPSEPTWDSSQGDSDEGTEAETTHHLESWWAYLNQSARFSRCAQPVPAL